MQKMIEYELHDARVQETDCWNRVYDEVLREVRGFGHPDCVSNIAYLYARSSVAEKIGDVCEVQRLSGWIAGMRVKEARADWKRRSRHHTGIGLSGRGAGGIVISGRGVGR